jgi:tRNA (mo5U34)-methyltransferase
MFDYSSLLEASDPIFPLSWLSELKNRLERRLAPSAHGDLARWRTALERLPKIAPSFASLDEDAPRIGAPEDCDEATRERLRAALAELHPWRKGPFLVHGVRIDAEWRSDLKWRRLCGQIRPLAGKTVLDVGCGNGYHCWRMAGAGAERVLGIDPGLLGVVQFHAIKRFAGERPVHVLPLGIEELPQELHAFDTVFSMGVLYHRRSPLDHLLELRGLLRPGGELALETLVIEGEAGRVLVPEDRYARMRNVWFIPSPPTLIGWLKRCGFRHIRLADVTLTGVEEQRATPWMRFQSLADFLDPIRPDLTAEGLPAPRRAILIAESP